MARRDPLLPNAGIVARREYRDRVRSPLFLVSTGVSVCLGHSLGMHRRLIHRAYDCPLWLERLFVYLGTLVGMQKCRSRRQSDKLRGQLEQGE